MYRAGRPALGARLLAAAHRVDLTRPVADIGCDHGKLAVWLALAGAPKVTAVDSRPMPLEKAKALVRQCGCQSRVRCLLGSGLEPLAPGEAEEIVIAGLGGEVTAEILAGCGWLQAADTHLVLVPTTRHAHLRRALCGLGFEIEDETAVLERRRPYTVISAVYAGGAAMPRPEPLFCQLGRLAGQRDEAAQSYIRARLAALEKQGLAPMDPAARAAHQKLVKEVEACLL